MNLRLDPNRTVPTSVAVITLLVLAATIVCRIGFGWDRTTSALWVATAALLLAFAEVCRRGWSR
jgi:hypothetical protein